MRNAKLRQCKNKNARHFQIIKISNRHYSIAIAIDVMIQSLFSWNTNVISEFSATPHTSLRTHTNTQLDTLNCFPFISFDDVLFLLFVLLRLEFGTRRNLPRRKSDSCFAMAHYGSELMHWLISIIPRRKRNTLFSSVCRKTTNQPIRMNSIRTTTIILAQRLHVQMLESKARCLNKFDSHCRY